MISNKIATIAYLMNPALPSFARLPINRCNQPSVILGGPGFQKMPSRLYIDGVYELHRTFFKSLDQLPAHKQRAEHFMDYMVVSFRMHKLEDAGLEPGDRNKRVNADYLHMLRGWLFDANGREAAVLKSWVESRFGLLTRYHKARLSDYNGHDYQLFLYERCRGLYGTNALEAQIDLLYTYCQYELAKMYETGQRLRLYRGINHIDSYEILGQRDSKHATLLLNNLNSFTSERERADEFGDFILEVEVPWQKILFYSKLFPESFSGESEVIVIGGVYEVDISR